mgnify:CR=1 FL=1
MKTSTNVLLVFLLIISILASTVGSKENLPMLTIIAATSIFWILVIIFVGNAEKMFD